MRRIRNFVAGETGTRQAGDFTQNALEILTFHY
jgi:hypothetical protein